MFYQHIPQAMFSQHVSLSSETAVWQPAGTFIILQLESYMSSIYGRNDLNI